MGQSGQAAVNVRLRQVWHIDVLEVNCVLEHPLGATSALTLIDSNAHVYKPGILVFLRWPSERLAIFVCASNPATVRNTYIQRLACKNKQSMRERRGKIEN